MNKKKNKFNQEDGESYYYSNSVNYTEDNN